MCPKAIQSLRYFYEQLPNLHIIAAGSLLDYQLEKVGLPVGRVQSFYMFPLTFFEFLSGIGREQLASVIIDNEEIKKISTPVHEQLLILWGEYMAVGGMP